MWLILLTLNIHWKDWCWSWSWSSITLATWCEEPTHWKRPRSWERLKAGGEGATQDETVGWHHWLNGHEFEQTPGNSRGQRSLACCSPWGHIEPDTTWQLNNKSMGCHTSLRSYMRCSFSAELFLLLAKIFVRIFCPQWNPVKQHPG